ncbi:MAG: hypothetical protein GDA38_21620 [Hormoscilla sp. SP12CHS1]|nr:hypothetical protein [Hormoscilla sp. SP12CHS1]
MATRETLSPENRFSPIGSAGVLTTGFLIAQRGAAMPRLFYSMNSSPISSATTHPPQPRSLPINQLAFLSGHDFSYIFSLDEYFHLLPAPECLMRKHAGITPRALLAATA